MEQLTRYWAAYRKLTKAEGTTYIFEGSRWSFKHTFTYHWFNNCPAGEPKDMSEDFWRGMSELPSTTVRKLLVSMSSAEDVPLLIKGVCCPVDILFGSWYHNSWLHWFRCRLSIGNIVLLRVDMYSTYMRTLCDGYRCQYFDMRHPACY